MIEFKLYLQSLSNDIYRISNFPYEQDLGTVFKYCFLDSLFKILSCGYFLMG